MPAAIHIGTSGWHYKHWKGPFYPADLPAARMLEFYQQRFDTVELNNSFYRLPPESALHAWRDNTSRMFCFAAKGSRFLTHMKKLADPGPGIGKFLSRIELLEPKLGPILFQLPPGWEVNRERLATFLDVLPRTHRYAFELRNQTWHTAEVFDILRAHNAAFCIYDLAGYQSGCEVTADFTYIRLHGPGGAYQGSYDAVRLGEWAERMRGWRRKLRAIYVYFDNDQNGFAARNALELRALVEQFSGRGG